jgi:hypothetical protein
MALRAASVWDPYCQRALLDIVFVLRAPDEVFARAGLRGKILRLGSGWREQQSLGPAREQFLELVSAP